MQHPLAPCQTQHQSHRAHLRDPASNLSKHNLFRRGPAPRAQPALARQPTNRLKNQRNPSFNSPATEQLLVAELRSEPDPDFTIFGEFFFPNGYPLFESVDHRLTRSKCFGAVRRTSRDGNSGLAKLKSPGSMLDG